MQRGQAAPPPSPPRIPHPHPRPRGRLCPFPRVRGQVRKGVLSLPLRLGSIPTRQVGKRRRRRFPSGVQGAAPPPGVQRVSLYPQTLEGGLGGTAVPAVISPLPNPILRARLGRNSRRSKLKNDAPISPPSRVQGAQPPPGVQGESPCTQKRWRVGRWDNGARQTRPSVEGGRRPRQNPRPHQRAGAGVRGPRHTSIAKCERLCYSTP